MFGNFAIGCGVMAAPGSLNDISSALAVSPAAAGQLVTAGAVAMGAGAPLLAAALAGWDRRHLLTMALLWYAAGHAAAALMPSFAALLPVRVIGVIAAAVFTPQAAGAINFLAPAEHRGRAITTVFMGWSLASVLGMPMGSFVAEAYGWRWAFGLVAVLSVAAAWGVWHEMPGGVKPTPLSWRSWRGALTHPLLMGMVAVTALSSAAQFTLFAYFAPYFRQVVGASAAQVSILYFWFGTFGVVGNVLLSRQIDRLGAARCVTIALGAIALSLLLWPLTGPGGVAASATGMALVLVPWGLGCFASNSAQQARVSESAPALAPALLAMNTSAIYVGQAIGAGSGGALLALQGFGPLPWAGLGWMTLALTLSTWAARRVKAGHA
jgi:predicted MFS family arabinose efflux permease